MEVCVCGVSHGPKQGGILAREGIAGEAGEEPDYRAEDAGLDAAGKVTDILQERGGLPSRTFWEVHEGEVRRLIALGFATR
jgi:hypothetical protein